jgi:asparagine synthase (glutamine-hydrolysing)
VCGIAGVAGEGAVGESGAVGRMLEAIVHRGPDEGGMATLPGAVLGSRRLSIIDLAGGRQPIANEDGTVHVVFNGEIYDFARHRRDLETAGHRFRTGADTEVLVHAYEERGERLLDDLNGMWGLALYDTRRRTLILARDRLGKKPLYWTLRDGQLWFASELKALLVDERLVRRVDLVSLHQYLTYECVPAPRTILAGVQKLEPGWLLSFHEGRVRMVQYWDVGFGARGDAAAGDGGRPPTYAEAIELLDAHLERAVASRLVADVPLGVFLSGGIDSSTVAWHAARLRPGIKTFTVGFSERSFDESGHARSVAAIVGSEHQERILSPRAALDLLPRVVDTLDEPFGDASVIPTTLLSAFAREQVKVALGGDGGDEVFLGYPTYPAHRLAELYARLPAGVRAAVEAAVERLPVSLENISLDFKLRRFVAGAARPAPVRNAAWLGSFAPGAAPAVLAPAVRRELRDADSGQPLAELLLGLATKHPLEAVQYLDFKIYMSEDILVKVDRASMSCSLEVRAPLLDYRLVDFVARLPLAYKLRGLSTKALLKSAMTGRLPRRILHRSKKGFGIPVGRWINGELAPLADATLERGKLDREGYLDGAEVQRLLAEHRGGLRDHRKVLWTLLMFELWLARHGCPR